MELPDDPRVEVTPPTTTTSRMTRIPAAKRARVLKEGTAGDGIEPAAPVVPAEAEVERIRRAMLE
jgi:hypothetical protein